MKTISVSPLDLKVGDKVLHHGCVMQVEVINKCVDEGSTVAACISRLVGDDIGNIPRSWFDTPESMVARGGRDYAKDLPEGRYWNVQGNHLARFAKIVE